MYQPQQFIEDLDLNITKNDISEIKQFEIEVKQVYQNKTKKEDSNAILSVKQPLTYENIYSAFIRSNQIINENNDEINP